MFTKPLPDPEFYRKIMMRGSGSVLIYYWFVSCEKAKFKTVPEKEESASPCSDRDPRGAARRPRRRPLVDTISTYIP
jgi:hypothetical protein